MRLVQKLIRERDQMLARVCYLEGMVAGIDRAIELLEPDEPEWIEDESGNPTRMIGHDPQARP